MCAVSSEREEQRTTADVIRRADVSQGVAKRRIATHRFGSLAKERKIEAETSILHERSQCCEPLAKLRKKSQCEQHWRHTKPKLSTYRELRSFAKLLVRGCPFFYLSNH